MTLDKKALQETMAQYRAWNEVDFAERVRNAGKKTPAEKWREYRSLFSLARSIKPELSPGAQVMAAREWEDYYEGIQLFEARRQSQVRRSHLEDWLAQSAEVLEKPGIVAHYQSM